MEKEELSVISVKVVVKGKGRDQSTERVVYMMRSKEPRTERWGTSQAEVCKDERLLSHLT